jgi:hypothetical protein
MCPNLDKLFENIYLTATQESHCYGVYNGAKQATITRKQLFRDQFCLLHVSADETNMAILRATNTRGNHLVDMCKNDVILRIFEDYVNFITRHGDD